MNKARRDTELQGMAMRQGTAQFGRSMPTTGIATDAAALNAGNSATGNLATQAGLHNAGTNAAQNWFGGATGANSAAGNLALEQYQGQLNAWQQASQNSASSAAGLGNLIGQLGSAYMMKPVPLRRGGIIKSADATGSFAATEPAGHASGGLSSVKRSNCAGGGLVQGPGTATSDSVPAITERHAAYPFIEWRSSVERGSRETAGGRFRSPGQRGGFHGIATASQTDCYGPETPSRCKNRGTGG